MRFRTDKDILQFLGMGLGIVALGSNDCYFGDVGLKSCQIVGPGFYGYVLDGAFYWNLRMHHNAIVL